jgi:hypothetical protein
MIATKPGLIFGREKAVTDKIEDQSQLADETDSQRFLGVIIILGVAFSAFAVAIIEVLALSGIWRPVQSALINILTAIGGLGAASLLLRNYNARAQQRLVDEGLRNRFSALQASLTSIERRVSNEIELTRRAALSIGNGKQQSFLLRDAPYADLFRNAREVGLLVQGWDRWIEERRRDLVQLGQRNGTFTLVVHNPNNENVIAAMSSRWTLRQMDQKAEITNTLNFVQDALPGQSSRIVKRDGVIWYCAIRFAYENPDDVAYIISPYAHQDYAVADIPAFLLRRSLSPELVEFFEYEWGRLSRA